MLRLKDGDEVTLEGRRGYVGSVGGYAARYDEDPDEAIAREIERHHHLYWINQAPMFITSDRQFARQEQERWSKVPELHDGDYVWFEGKVMVVHYKGNYSDMGELKPIR